MAFPFTEDHAMIREAARGFLQNWYDGGKGPERVFESGTGYDEVAWQGLGIDLGMAGISIDEAYGGAGLGDLGRVVVMEELGASLCSVPFSPSATIASDMLSEFGFESTKGDWLPRLASGEIIAAYADGKDALTLIDSELSGQVKNILYGAQADIILFSLKKENNCLLIGLPKTTTGLCIDSIETMDPTRSFANITFENVTLKDEFILGEGRSEQFDAVVKTSLVGLAAECVGGAQQCLDMTLEYAGQRVQFDRPIASFQAIKHRCADMFVQIEAARSAVYAAALAEGKKKTELALIAKAYASDAFFEVTGHAIQLHGGIGFTWEYPLHFYFKRARANRTVFGSSTRDYALLADRIFGDAA